MISPSPARRASRTLIGSGIALAIAGAAALAPTPAFAADDDAAQSTDLVWSTEDDSYTLKIYDGGVPGWQRIYLLPECKAGYYLDKRLGTDGMSVGKGFRVNKEAPVDISEMAIGRKGPVVGKERFITGTTLDMWSWIGGAGLTITMGCTASKDFAWREPTEGPCRLCTQLGDDPALPPSEDVARATRDSV